MAGLPIGASAPPPSNPMPKGTVGPSAAPQFVAPAPPNRVQMSVQQHYDAILSVFKTRPPKPDEIAATQNFFVQFQQIAQEEMQEPGGQMDEGANDQPMPGGPASSLRSAEQPYGTSAGSTDLGYGG